MNVSILWIQKSENQLIISLGGGIQTPAYVTSNVVHGLAKKSEVSRACDLQVIFP